MVSPGTQLTQSIPSDLARPSSGNSKTRLIVLNLLLIAGTLALYAPVHHYPFVNYDDPWYVSNNPYIKDGINADMLHWAFMSRGYCHNWHPVTWISHALDIEMFGLNPAGHHDENVVLHALDVVLLFWVLRQATGYTGRSFMAAALFAVHPMNVECVAWLSERKTMLSMVFFLLALAAYREYARKPSDGRYTLVALLYVLGLMAKPQVIALPLLLLLWDYWPLQRMFASEPSSEPAAETFPATSLWELVKEKIPLFVIAAGSALMTMLAQEVGTPQYWPYTLSIRLQNAIVSYARYVEDLFWPSRLAPFYPHPGNSLTAWQVGSAFLFLLIVTGLVLAGRRHRYLPVGWLWFLISLIPMIGLVQVWEQAMADRYAYQSFLGLFIIVCWGAAEWAEKRRLPSAVLPTAGLAVLLALSLVARRQIGYWKDSVTLWSRSLEVTPNNNFIGEQSMGYVLIKAGRRAEALPHFAKALEMRPTDALSNLEIGFQEHEEGNLSGAIEHYQQVLNATDTSVDLKRRALVNMGHAYADKGDTERARQCFESADRLPSG
jgi:tetratricopeptide (TPR) repeat protein